MNLEKQLQENAKKLKQRESVLPDEIVKDVKLLLENNMAEERQLLKTLGMDNHIRVVEDEMGKKIEDGQYSEEWGEFFTRENIQDICLDYNLRFLPAKHFNGNITNDLGSVVLRFCKKHNINTGDINLNSKFHVMAPAKMFKLQDRPKDPLLFYEINERHHEGDKRYVLVHQWGNDLSWTRAISGLFSRSQLNRIIFRILTITCILTALTGLFGAFHPGVLIGTFLVSSLFVGIVVGADTDINNRRSNSWLWNSEFKN